ncbi:MAG: peptidoglycan-associated lipoprotein Pal [Polaromonas sp.]|nr:peptidoglycan-associated lipoprotein Pal [Polaromonas sp.]
MKRHLFSIISVVVLTALLAACGSSVKLDEVPVESRTATPVTAQSNTRGAASTGVAPVEILANNSAVAGPAGVAKIIYFDYDSFTLRPEFQGAVEAHAKYMASNRVRKMAIEGHTDERGGREYNLALGQKRAEAVRRALGLLGVTDVQVEAVSFGKEKPAAEGSDEASLAKNRRAELRYR